jgi:ubiquinone/menaquinone biosynthesis C-methylase UbiE
MTIDLPYESTARFYDAAHAAMPSLGPDAQFYETLAAEIGGPVLEVGCGTGRVLLPIAARGIECAGIDASPAMLDECRRKPGAGAIALSCARMQSFDLGKRRFRLVYSAFRAFQHLETVDDQLACLARVRAHLEPDGVLAFDVFNPRLERVALDDEPEAQDLVFARAGRAMRRFTRITRDRATQLMQVTMRYVADASADGRQSAEETRVTFSMRWFWRYELEHLLHRAGFTQIEMFGDFDRSPIRRDSPAFLVVARQLRRSSG